jgi:hypothetical protein
MANKICREKNMEVEEIVKRKRNKRRKDKSK